jgi:alpha-amylase
MFANSKDVDALSLFIDNHDNQRFLFEVPKEEYWRLNNALAFIFHVRGIPTLYYGTEQSFTSSGDGGDPWCRAPLWTSKFDQEAEFYKYVAALNKNRTDQ